MNQISFDDLELRDALINQPGRTAFIDESGSFGFDFSTEGASKYYILCAIIVQNSRLDDLHKVVEVVRNNNFGTSEMKSNVIGNNYKRRNKIIAELLPIDFRIILLVTDKQEFIKGSPLSLYKKTFIKFIHQRLYNMLYSVYPKLKIIEDQTGTSEFQESFKNYIAENRPDYNLLDEYEFEYTDSKDSLLVQLADIIGGTINKYYTDPDSPNYLEMLRAKIIRYEEFPNKNKPYFATTNPNDCKYDDDIFKLSIRCAETYISGNEYDESLEKRLQIAFLKYLLFQVFNVDAHHYISSAQIVYILKEYSDKKISRDFLYRKIIAHLRDKGVILASCTQGYKIPICLDDITTYLNQTHTVVSPMLHRMDICRNLIRQQTDNHLDILDNDTFIRYKMYFD